MTAKEMKAAFYTALDKMVRDGELDKIAESMPKHSARVKDFKASLDQVGGIENVPLVAVLGVLAEDEPILATVLTYMVYIGEGE